MSKRLTVQEVLLLKSAARTALLEAPRPCILPDSGQYDLGEGELVAISYLQGSLALLNRRGLLVPDWQEKFEILLWNQYSEPDVDYHDYDDGDPKPKAPKKN